MALYKNLGLFTLAYSLWLIHSGLFITMRILLIEDDPIICHRLEDALRSQRYVTEIVVDGDQGLNYALSDTYDLIVLDINLPLKDGITVCKSVRAEGIATPILLITARDTPEERVKGLDAGGDDYLVKPIDTAEFLARVRALIRRKSDDKSPVLTAGDLSLNPSSCDVTYHNTPLTLTPKEFSLLELMMRSPNRVFSRGEILEHLWTFDDPPLEDSVKAHVKGLRAKLKKMGAHKWIENVYGVGYRFVPKLDRPSISASSHLSSPSEPAHPIDELSDPKVQSLWNKFQPVMLERLQVLRQTAEAIQNKTYTSQLAESAEQAAHKLAGVLGSFERQEGTEIARELEQLFEGRILNQMQRNTVLRLIEELAEHMKLPTITSDTLYPIRYIFIHRDSAFETELQTWALNHRSRWLSCDQFDVAITEWETHQPEVLVIDIDEHLTIDQALHFITQLKENSTPSKILLLLPEADIRDRLNLSAAGDYQILSKPVTVEQVWAAIEMTHPVTNRGNETILIVDDDPVFLEMMRSFLAPWPLDVKTLQDPRDIMGSLEATQPNILLLDIDMPHVNGLQLCQAIRADLQWQQLPILFITAQHSRTMIHQGFVSGADDYITKPVVEAELLTRIQQRLERGRLLRMLSTQEPITRLTNFPESCRLIEQRVRQLETTQHTQCFCCLFRLTRLDEINQQHGHSLGHQILKRFARTLEAEAPPHSLLSYWGNGDFILLTAPSASSKPQDDIANICRFARRLMYSTPEGDRTQVHVSWASKTIDQAGETPRSLYRTLAEQLTCV